MKTTEGGPSARPHHTSQCLHVEESPPGTEPCVHRFPVLGTFLLGSLGATVGMFLPWWLRWAPFHNMTGQDSHTFTCKAEGDGSATSQPVCGRGKLTPAWRQEQCVGHTHTE